jgi:hypothetical protein
LSLSRIGDPCHFATCWTNTSADHCGTLSGGINVLDVGRVGDPKDLPLSSTDSAVLLWAEREARILISEDKSTLTDHLAAHLASGHHSPGIMLPRPTVGRRAVLEFLVLAAHASEPHEWRDAIWYIP